MRVTVSRTESGNSGSDSNSSDQGGLARTREGVAKAGKGVPRHHMTSTMLIRTRTTGRGRLFRTATATTTHLLTCSTMHEDRHHPDGMLLPHSTGSRRPVHGAGM